MTEPQYLSSRAGAATLSIASNTILIALKVVIGLLTGSVSVISEAIHSSTDLLAAVIAFFAIRSAARPADADHPYGHAKYESLAAIVEALLIVAAAGLIVYEAVRRLYSGTVIVNVDWAIAVMLTAATTTTVDASVSLREGNVTLRSSDRISRRDCTAFSYISCNMSHLAWGYILRGSSTP